MCFACEECAHYIGSTFYTCERLVSCCAMTAVVCCLIATLLIMLGMGVGIGYNYCYVGNKIAPMIDFTLNPDEETTAKSLRRIQSRKSYTIYDYRSLEKGNEPKKSEYNYTKRVEILTGTSTTSYATLPFLGIMKMKPTMVIPLRKPDLLSFITRLVQNNKNVTLELIL